MRLSVRARVLGILGLRETTTRDSSAFGYCGLPDAALAVESLDALPNVKARRLTFARELTRVNSLAMFLSVETKVETKKDQTRRLLTRWKIDSRTQPFDSIAQQCDDDRFTVTFPTGIKSPCRDKIVLN